MGGDERLARLEHHLQDRHRGALDVGLHRNAPLAEASSLTGRAAQSLPPGDPTAPGSRPGSGPDGVARGGLAGPDARWAGVARPGAAGRRADAAPGPTPPRALVRGSVTAGSPPRRPRTGAHAPRRHPRARRPPHAVARSSSTELAAEIRTCIVERVTANGGTSVRTWAPSSSPWPSTGSSTRPATSSCGTPGHQAYVHKLVTGRQEGFATLRQPGGMSGYPSRAESPHDWIENSHASTALSYAHGIAMGLRPAGASATAGWWRSLGRRVAHRRHGLRGAQQPRPRRHPRCHRARTTTGGPTHRRCRGSRPASPSCASTRPMCTPGSGRATSCARIPGLGGLAYSSLHGLTERGARDRHARTASSRPSASATPGPSTATTSPAWSRRSPTPPSGTGRSSSTSSPRRAAATPRPKKTTSSACTTSRCSPPPVAPRPAIAPASYTDAFTRAVLDGGARGARGRGHHRGHARAHRASSRSRPSSPTVSSTSASPSSTP